MALVAAGCVAEEDLDVIESTGEEEHLIQRQEIMGGSVDQSAQYAGVVGMFTSNGQFGGICSGTLIAPNLVLTAQHCVAPTASEYVDCSNNSAFGAAYTPRNIAVTTKTYMTNDGRDYVAGREVHVPPGGNNMCGFDIALVILDRNIPSGQAVPIAPRLDQPVRVNETYTAVGYGHTGNGSGSGVRRYLGNRRIQCGGINPCPSRIGVTSTEMLGTDGTCQATRAAPRSIHRVACSARSRAVPRAVAARSTRRSRRGRALCARPPRAPRSSAATRCPAGSATPTTKTRISTRSRTRTTTVPMCKPGSKRRGQRRHR